MLNCFTHDKLTWSYISFFSLPLIRGKQTKSTARIPNEKQGKMQDKQRVENVMYILSGARAWWLF